MVEVGVCVCLLCCHPATENLVIYISIYEETILSHRRIKIGTSTSESSCPAWYIFGIRSGFCGETLKCTSSLFPDMRGVVGFYGFMKTFWLKERLKNMRMGSRIVGHPTGEV